MEMKFSLKQSHIPPITNTICTHALEIKLNERDGNNSNTSVSTSSCI